MLLDALPGFWGGCCWTYCGFKRPAEASSTVKDLPMMTHPALRSLDTAWGKGRHTSVERSPHERARRQTRKLTTSARDIQTKETSKKGGWEAALSASTGRSTVEARGRGVGWSWEGALRSRDTRVGVGVACRGVAGGPQRLGRVLGRAWRGILQPSPPPPEHTGAAHGTQHTAHGAQRTAHSTRRTAQTAHSARRRQHTAHSARAFRLSSARASSKDHGCGA